MHPFIASRKDRIAELCQRHGVERLELFGSATGPGFDPGRSDVDLIVRFGQDGRARLLDAYFGLKQDLEGLFGLPVDLLTPASVRNPYLRESIETSKQTLYAA